MLLLLFYFEIEQSILERERAPKPQKLKCTQKRRVIPKCEIIILLHIIFHAKVCTVIQEKKKKKKYIYIYIYIFYIVIKWPKNKNI